MSLIGSLEDLGLGDILQIIHLSQKSGVLSIRGDAGEGRLVFQGGLVRLASLKGDPENLRELVVDRGFVTADEFDKASTVAGESGCELSVAIANSTAVSLERIESLRRECVERAVGTMFSWSAGDFSFDVGAEDEYVESDMALSTGVNAQYLAMESLRVWDEGGRGQAGEEPGNGVPTDASEDDLDLDMSAEEMFGVAATAPEPTPAPTAVDSLVEVTAIHVQPALEAEAGDSDMPEASLVGNPIELTPIAELIDPSSEAALPSPGLAAFDLETGFNETASTEAENGVRASEMPMSEPIAQPEPTAESQVIPAVAATVGKIQYPVDVETSTVSSQPVVVIAPELSVLEWVRSSLSEKFTSVHIFQRSQEGLGRIRQYLARAQAPILVVSPRIEGNPLSGIVDAADFVSRLQGQAPRMPILWLVAQDEAEESLAPVALPSVIHPPLKMLSGASSAADHEELSRQVGATLTSATAAHTNTEQKTPVVAEAKVSEGSAVEPKGDSGLERLRRETRALSDASNRGEILPVVIRFAADSFARVAIFMVRGDEVLGMAQHGIESIGGPTDVEMRALRFGRSDSSWFEEVIETRRPVRSAIRNEGDRRVCELIGGSSGGEAYVAPILSGENVVAILFADNGSRAGDLAESSGLEVVLQHAGLALDRAALERALAEVDEPN